MSANVETAQNWTVNPPHPPTNEDLQRQGQRGGEPNSEKDDDDDDDDDITAKQNFCEKLRL